MKTVAPVPTPTVYQAVLGPNTVQFESSAPDQNRVFRYGVAVGHLEADAKLVGLNFSVPFVPQRPAHAWGFSGEVGKPLSPSVYNGTLLPPFSSHYITQTVVKATPYQEHKVNTSWHNVTERDVVTDTLVQTVTEERVITVVNSSFFNITLNGCLLYTSPSPRDS